MTALSEPGPGPVSDTAAAAHRMMRGRRSIRRYRSEAIGRDVLDRLFLSAAAAPSAHNRQPWRYLVIEDAATKDRLARAMGRRLSADRGRDGDAPDVIARDVARSHARITGAPAVILVCLTLEETDVYPDAARGAAEFLMAVHSTAMATQNLLLGAHAEGLAACWMCAPLFCPEVVREAARSPRGLAASGAGDARPCCGRRATTARASRSMPMSAMRPNPVPVAANRSNGLSAP